MKIIMLCDFYKEGLEYQENLLTKYYVKHGHNVTVITSTFESVFDYYAGKHDNSIPEKDFQHNGARIIKLRFAYNFGNKIKKFTSIFGILESIRPDLIYIHDIMPNMLEGVKYIKRNPDCKMIMDYHADYSNSGKNWLSLKILHGFIRKRFFLDRSRKYISKIFPIVPTGFTFLNEIYGISVEEMELLPLGADVDLAEVVKANQDGLLIRKKFNIPDDAFVIFTGGKLSPRKQTHLLIEALNSIKSKTDIYLIIVGDSSEENQSYKKRYRSLAAKNKNIYFLGWLNNEQIYKCMDASDISVFPASQSIMWQQAISMGLPLICGDTGGQSISYLNKYNNIIILEKEDITSKKIQEEILKLKNDSKKISIMKNGAEKITKEMLNWNILIQKTLRFNVKD